MSNRIVSCWICGAEGTSGEHKTKRSDLRGVFGERTQQMPLYFHNDAEQNRRIGSLDAKVFKSPSRLCGNCNNARTQPHDRAWEQMSEALRTRRPTIMPGTIVRANRIFTYDTARQMLNMHLFFVKLFGCHILEAGMPIDLATFAKALVSGKAHPNLYLKFGCNSAYYGKAIAGMSDIHADNNLSDGSCAFASWLYFLDHLAVNVMFAEAGEKREGLVDAWHPRLSTNRLVIADL